MYILNSHMRRSLNIDRREVPQSSDTCEAELVCNFLGDFFRRADDAYVDVVVLNELNNAFIIHDFNTVDLSSDEFRLNFEDALHNETRLIVISVVYDGFAEITGSYNDHLILSVQSEDGANLVVKAFYAVSISLLAESAEVVQILSDL